LAENPLGGRIHELGTHVTLDSHGPLQPVRLATGVHLLFDFLSVHCMHTPCCHLHHLHVCMLVSPSHLTAHSDVHLQCMAAKQGPSDPVLHAKYDQLYLISEAARRALHPRLLSVRPSIHPIYPSVSTSIRQSDLMARSSVAMRRVRRCASASARLALLPAERRHSLASSNCFLSSRSARSAASWEASRCLLQTPKRWL
jgi:hypothetical protein